MKKIYIISFCVIAVLAFCAWVAMHCLHYENEPINLPKDKQVLVLPDGVGVSYLSQKLKKTGLITSPFIFKLWMMVQGEGARLQTGEYRIAPGTTIQQLVLNMASGKVVRRKITLIEGWTFYDFRVALAKDPYLKHETNELGNQKIMTELNEPETSPEGMFFPDTYSYTRGDSDINILRRANKKMLEEIDAAWKGRAIAANYRTPYDALIVASIIEKETAVGSERSMIASVILNRLKIRMPLQIDPTVMYGIEKSYPRPVTVSELKIDTPYNTYKHYGLPPTPICMPGKASIYAALHPEVTKYLYYVSRGDGTHQFSESYKQHRAAIKQYLQQPTAPSSATKSTAK
jgi:UPF0755 protein